MLELVGRFVPALGEEWRNQLRTENCEETDKKKQAKAYRHHQVHNLCFSSRENILDVTIS
jgi:hypothetical protein